MWCRYIVCMLALAQLAWAGGGDYFQRAMVMQMDATQCQAARPSILATLAGTEEPPKKVDCAEYVLISPTTIFRVQASKSSPLMLLSEQVNFRAGKGHLVLRRDDETTWFEVTVVCMRLLNSRQNDCAETEEIERPKVATSKGAH